MTNAAASDRLKNDRANNNNSNAKSELKLSLLNHEPGLMMEINQISRRLISNKPRNCFHVLKAGAKSAARLYDRTSTCDWHVC